MKTSYGRFVIFSLILTLLFLLCGFHFKQQNNLLLQTTANFDQTLQQEQDLIKQNACLKKRWKCNKDIPTELSRYLILPKIESSDTPIEIYDPELQQHISIYENYLSSFIAYDDCVKVLEKLCEAQLPILITSLSIHRNIAHNYALQISMTYRTK